MAHCSPKRDRFELLSVEHFWLSETPEVPGSIAWDAVSRVVIFSTRRTALEPNLSSANFRLSRGWLRWSTYETAIPDRKTRQPRQLSTTLKRVHSTLLHQRKFRRTCGSLTRCVERLLRHVSLPLMLDHPQFCSRQHFDHMGIVARARSSEVILSKLRPHMMRWNDAGQPPLVMVMGDLNSPPEEEGYQVLTGHRYTEQAAVPPRSDVDAGLSFLDTRHAVALRAAPSGRAMAGLPAQILLKKQYGCIGTFSEFGKNIDGAVIDHIMVADNGALQPATPASTFAVSEKTTGIPKDHSGGKWRVTKYGVIPNKIENGQYPYRLSDHCLVMSELSRAS